MKLLLISNSTNAGEEYLRYPMPEIGRFLQGVSEIVFVPYAAVTFPTPSTKKGAGTPLGAGYPRALGTPGQRPPRAWYAKRKPCASGRQHLRAGKKMQEQGLMAAILRKSRPGLPMSAGRRAATWHVPPSAPQTTCPSSSHSRSGLSEP
mgnify:CR=1 FL=1